MFKSPRFHNKSSHFRQPFRLKVSNPYFSLVDYNHKYEKLGTIKHVPYVPYLGTYQGTKQGTSTSFLKSMNIFMENNRS